ncbi:MAG: CHAP domain-containing protein [Bacteroidota bacterium]
MSKKTKLIVIACIAIIIALTTFLLLKEVNPNPNFKIGQALDSLNGVKVYYNGGVGHTGKRNVSVNGYNIGLTYQCVEFVKRYYYQYYHHEMPDSYGNAKDFFDSAVKDGAVNKRRNLLQYTSPSRYKPQIGDLVIFDGHGGNPYGHVAIISDVTAHTIEIIQQNPGPFAPSRVRFDMDSTVTGFTIQHERLLGRLRMKKQNS